MSVDAASAGPSSRNSTGSLVPTLRRVPALISALAGGNGATLWATWLFVALGVALRSRGFLFDRHGLGQDEATWAMMVMRDPLITLLIRPIAFMSVAKALALVFGPYEVVLRAQCWLAGVATCFLAVALARRLFRNPAARLLFVAVIALHPAAIDLSKEFKPYAVTLFVHMGLLFLCLRYLQTQRAAHLCWFLAGAALGGLWAQDAVMAYPATFLVVTWDTWKNQRRRVLWVLAGAAVVIGIFVLQYVFIWSRIASHESDMWGHKYGVFYVPGRQSYLDWWLDHYRALAQFPGLRREFWDTHTLARDELRSIATADASVWLVLHVAGMLALLVGKRWREAWLLLMPFAVLTVFNRLGHWPAGAFRTNLFFLTYTAAIAAMAIDAMPPNRHWRAMLPALVLVALPLVALDRMWNARKVAHCYDSDMGRIVEKLAEIARERPAAALPPLVISRRSCDQYEYYSEVHPDLKRFGPLLRERYRATCVNELSALRRELSRTMRKERRAFFLTDVAHREVEGIIASMPDVQFEKLMTTRPHRLLEMIRGS